MTSVQTQCAGDTSTQLYFGDLASATLAKATEASNTEAAIKSRALFIIVSWNPSPVTTVVIPAGQEHNDPGAVLFPSSCRGPIKNNIIYIMRSTRRVAEGLAG